MIHPQLRGGPPGVSVRCRLGPILTGQHPLSVASAEPVTSRWSGESVVGLLGPILGGFKQRKLNVSLFWSREVHCQSSRAKIKALAGTAPARDPRGGSPLPLPAPGAPCDPGLLTSSFQPLSSITWPPRPRLYSQLLCLPLTRTPATAFSTPLTTIIPENVRISASFTTPAKTPISCCIR